MGLPEIDQLPMALGATDIERWVAHVIAATDNAARRAEALIDLQDRQAIHQPLFSDPVRAAIGAWLERVWRFDDLPFLDAAATVILSQDLCPDLLKQTMVHGTAEAVELARDALDEL